MFSVVHFANEFVLAVHGRQIAIIAKTEKLTVQTATILQRLLIAIAP